MVYVSISQLIIKWIIATTEKDSLADAEYTIALFVRPVGDVVMNLTMPAHEHPGCAMTSSDTVELIGWPIHAIGKKENKF
jgi:hypothetical protein